MVKYTNELRFILDARITAPVVKTLRAKTLKGCSQKQNRGKKHGFGINCLVKPAKNRRN
jgi:hypothetical protein